MVARKLGISRFELARKLRIAPRTLATRKGKTLSALESEKTFRAERIFDEAAEVFASIDEARIWMNSPQRGLENQNPSDLLDTDIGAGHVQNYLSAIKYGNVW